MEWLLSNNNHFYDVSIPSVALMIFPLYSYIPVSHQTFNTTIPQSSTLLSLVCFSTFRSEGFHKVVLILSLWMKSSTLKISPWIFVIFLLWEKRSNFLFFFFWKINCLQQHQAVGFTVVFICLKAGICKWKINYWRLLNNCQLSIDSCYWHQNAEPIHDKPIKALVYNSAVLLHF